jgi:U3 small nucleolar RNA-associated protein 10
MVSSLAAQLAQNASLNASLLVDRTRRKPTESYLFTGEDADQYDLDSLYALAVNGFLQLESLNPSLGAYEDALFSNAAKATDRTLLTAEAIAELDASISSCLQALGPYLLDAPTGKVLEWLVRRFRINEFNVEAILALFLPYHETPHFAKMNTILHIKCVLNGCFPFAH